MAAIPPPTASIPSQTPKVDEHVDYKNLSCPIPFEEIHREALMSLKPESFEGTRFDYNKALTPNFFLSHSATMGPMEVPSQSPETLKIPTSNYEFGANYIDPKLMLIGRISKEGRLSARFKYDLLDDLSIKANGQLTNEPDMSHGMGILDYKGSDYRTQFQFGSGALLGANYIQSVTPNLSLGGEIFYAGEHRKSGVGYAARYSNDKMLLRALDPTFLTPHEHVRNRGDVVVFAESVATGQVASTGMVALSYVQKASEKMSLATELMYNYMSREVTASVGYDAILRQARVRGKIDSNGCVTTFVEERLSPGLGFLLSAELDHWKKDYKFGFGMNVGE